jgi:hypothetical protein
VGKFCALALVSASTTFRRPTLPGIAAAAHPATTDSRPLTPAQLRKVKPSIDRSRWHLIRLVGRMKERGFPPGDPMLTAAGRACGAVDEFYELVEATSYGRNPIATGRTMAGATPRDGRAKVA